MRHVPWRAILTALAAALAARNYIELRAMGETFGFQWRVFGLCAGISVALILALAVIGGYGVAVVQWWRGRPFSRWGYLVVVGWLVAGAMAGSIVGEGWVVADEFRFVREVAARGEAGQVRPYARDRVWPLGGTTMVYTPERGFTATD